MKHTRRTKNVKKKDTHRKKDESSDSASSVSSSSSSSCSSAEKRDGKMLRRGVRMACLPFVRLQAMLRHADMRFDHMWTVGMTSDMVCMLLWAVCRIRPDCLSHKLGVKTYKAAQKQCRSSCERQQAIMGEQQYELMISELLRAGQQGFECIVVRYGFQEEWLVEPTRKKHKGAAAAASAASSVAELERQLDKARSKLANALPPPPPPKPAGRFALGGQSRLPPFVPELQPPQLAPPPPPTPFTEPAARSEATPPGGSDSGASNSSHSSHSDAEGAPPEPSSAAAMDVEPEALAPAQGNSQRRRHPVAEEEQPAAWRQSAVAEEEPPAASPSSAAAGTQVMDVATPLPTQPEALAPARGNSQRRCHQVAEEEQPAAWRQSAVAEEEPPAASPSSAAAGTQVMDVSPPLPTQPEAPAPAQGNSDNGTLSEDQVRQIAENRAKARARRAAKAKSRVAPPEPEQQRDTVVETEEPAREDPQCVICQSPMLIAEERLALQCMHTFHRYCIMGYAECKGQPLNKCCPFKCDVSSADVTVTLDDADEDQGGGAVNAASSSLLEQASRVTDGVSAME